MQKENRRIKRDYMNIVFFGGNKITEEYFNEIYITLKEVFKNKKHNIIAGGTCGTMEAVAKAAKENNLHTIGILLDKWKSYLNAYNDEIELFASETERLHSMISKGDIYVCLDGELGTFAELFPTLMEIEDNNKKLYIAGKKMQKLLDMLIEEGYLAKYIRDNVEYIELEELKEIL